MIIVSLNGNDIFSPHPGILLKNREGLLEFGLEILKRFSDRIVVTARKNSLETLGKISDHITHIVPDTYPAWDPLVVLYHIKKNQQENCAWCIASDHLAMMAQFLLTGHYPVEKLFTVTKFQDKKPHILTRQGVPIRQLAGDVHKDSLILRHYGHLRFITLMVSGIAMLQPRMAIDLIDVFLCWKMKI